MQTLNSFYYEGNFKRSIVDAISNPSVQFFIIIYGSVNGRVGIFLRVAYCLLSWENLLFNTYVRFNTRLFKKKEKES